MGIPLPNKVSENKGRHVSRGLGIIESNREGNDQQPPFESKVIVVVIGGLSHTEI